MPPLSPSPGKPGQYPESSRRFLSLSCQFSAPAPLLLLRPVLLSIRMQHTLEATQSIRIPSLPLMTRVTLHNIHYLSQLQCPCLREGDTKGTSLEGHFEE